MGTIGTLGRRAWRYFVTDGVEASGVQRPDKADILPFVNAVDAAVDAMSVAGTSIVQDTWAHLSAITGTLLGQQGQVYNDAGTHTDPVYTSSHTVTTTIASPCVVSWTGHGLPIGAIATLSTTGALPTGLSAATPYYIIAAGYGANAFQLSATPGGPAINTSGTQSGTHTATITVPSLGVYTWSVSPAGWKWIFPGRSVNGPLGDVADRIAVFDGAGSLLKGGVGTSFTPSYHQGIGGVAGQNINDHSGGDNLVRADENVNFADIDSVNIVSADPTSGPVFFVPSLANGTQPGGTPPDSGVTVGFRVQYTAPDGVTLRDFNIMYTTGTATGVGQASANGQYTSVLNNGGVGTSALTWKAIAIGLSAAFQDYMVANPAIGADWNDTSRKMSPLWTSTVGGEGTYIINGGNKEAFAMDFQYPMTRTLQLTPINAGNVIISDGYRMAAAAITFTANATNGSATLTNIQGANRTQLSQGMLLTGTGMPAGVYIKYIAYDSANIPLTITLSANATATNTGVTLTMNGIYIPLAIEVNPILQLGRSLPGTSGADRALMLAGAPIGALYSISDNTAGFLNTQYFALNVTVENANAGHEQARITLSQGGQNTDAGAQLNFGRGIWLTNNGTEATGGDIAGSVNIPGGYYINGALLAKLYAAPVNTAALTVSGFSLTGANAQSFFDLSGTWNTSGTPTGLKFNIVDTASNAASLLLDLQKGGTSQFKVDKSGVANVTGGYSINGVSISTSLPAPFGITSGSNFISLDPSGGAYGLKIRSNAPAGQFALTFDETTVLSFAQSSSSDRVVVMLTAPQPIVFGTNSQERFAVNAGIYTSGATGGDKGADSLNAKNYYNDGALLAKLYAAPVNTAALTVSGFSLTGANAQSFFDLSGTWNTSGTPTGLKFNIVDTASNAASLLLDLQKGGTSQFKVDKSGVANVTGGYSINGVSIFNLPARTFATSSGVLSLPQGAPAAGTYLMAGLAGTITPTTSGNVQFTIQTQLTDANAAKSIGIKLAYGTGTAPANAAAATGTTVGQTMFDNLTTNHTSTFTGYVTGLTRGTAYWFDLQIANVTDATNSIAVISGTNLMAIEL